MRKLPALFFVGAVAAACHDAVFSPPPVSVRGPVDSGSVHRVTLNPGADLFPAWLPDGSAIVYSYDANGFPPFRARCVGAIAPEGGTRTEYSCKLRAASDSIDESDWPAPGPGGSLAYSWSPFGRNPYLQDSTVVLVGTLASAGAGRPAFSFPYIPAGSKIRKYTAASSFGWLNATTLIASAYVTTIVQDTSVTTFKPETCGKDVILLDLTTSPATLSVVANTATSTSVAVGASGIIYYTLMGDSRVYRRVLATGEDSVVHDFGAAGIARDVSVGGGRLAAIVGGTVGTGVDPVNGEFQEDHGGLIHVVTLATDADTVLPDSGFVFRHPALSPTGDRLEAEAWQGKSVDLWFFKLP